VFNFKGGIYICIKQVNQDKSVATALIQDKITYLKGNG